METKEQRTIDLGFISTEPIKDERTALIAAQKVEAAIYRAFGIPQKKLGKQKES